MSGGGNVLSPKVIQNLFESMEGGSGGEGSPARAAGSLTQRETDILALLAEARATETSPARCSCRRRPSRRTWPPSSGS
jgi:hypothetical protein